MKAFETDPKPSEIVVELISAAEKKASLSAGAMLLSGALAGAMLSIAVTASNTAIYHGWTSPGAAILFPMGFIVLMLLGYELVTGNFALLTMGVAAERIHPSGLIRNWLWVYAGNLLGGTAYAYMYWAVCTHFGADTPEDAAAILAAVAEQKTLQYKADGAAGWMTALLKAVLANWMVTTGSVMVFTSRSTPGRILAMWLPIYLFYMLRYEHCVVNMFVIPGGMLFGARITIMDWWVWNQIPVTIGNILGGALLTAFPLYMLHPKRCR